MVAAVVGPATPSSGAVVVGAPTPDTVVVGSTDTGPAGEVVVGSLPAGPAGKEVDAPGSVVVAAVVLGSRGSVVPGSTYTGMVVVVVGSVGGVGLGPTITLGAVVVGACVVVGAAVVVGEVVGAAVVGGAVVREGAVVVGFTTMPCSTSYSLPLFELVAAAGIPPDNEAKLRVAPATVSTTAGRRVFFIELSPVRQDCILKSTEKARRVV